MSNKMLTLFIIANTIMLAASSGNNCSMFLPPENGIVSGRPSCQLATVTDGGNCTVSCQQGYALTNGTTINTCVNGTWSFPPAAYACEEPCLPIPSPNNGNISDCSTHSSGKTCKLACFQGYVPSNGSVNCVNGTWNNNRTMCQQITCGAISIPANGRTTCADVSHTYGSTCRISCNKNYNLISGSNTTTCGITNSTSPLGAWSGNTTYICNAGSTISLNTVLMLLGILFTITG